MSKQGLEGINFGLFEGEHILGHIKLLDFQREMFDNLEEDLQLDMGDALNVQY